VSAGRAEPDSPGQMPCRPQSRDKCQRSPRLAWKPSLSWESGRPLGEQTMTGGYSLSGDIGGTNARFALVRPNSVRRGQIRVLPVREHENLDAAAHHYLARKSVA